MRIRNLNPGSLRTAAWTLRAAHRAKQRFASPPFGTDLGLPRVPRVGPKAVRGVTGVLGRRPYSCLVDAAVRQAWLAAQGCPRDLIIGVAHPSGGFGAHAWLDGDPPGHHEGFHELVRLQP